MPPLTSRCMTSGLAVLLAAAFVCLPAQEAQAKTRVRQQMQPSLTAQAYVIVDAKDGSILNGKMPRKKLPPASTAKIMTVLVALQYLPLDFPAPVSQRALDVSPSKAGLTLGAKYLIRDLVKACLVSSSNDAAIAIAEAVAGNETDFAKLMNKKARSIGMTDTRFVNATGLTDEHRQQVTTAYDLTKMIREAMKDSRIDEMMGLTEARIRGSDGRWIDIKAHNKMLWKTPNFVKGKTGWTRASRYTFVGTNYSPQKSIAFAMLFSKEPWTDIERLASFGLLLVQKR
jgi:D-alanyl-D-alanine carboxypeptidase (penicillin-binding protein 5/6)